MRQIWSSMKQYHGLLIARGNGLVQPQLAVLLTGPLTLSSLGMAELQDPACHDRLRVQGSRFSFQLDPWDAIPLTTAELSLASFKHYYP